MWMGDYPELPAKILETGEELHKVIEDNKEQLLGQNSIRKFGVVLPYLPKVRLLADEACYLPSLTSL